MLKEKKRPDEMAEVHPTIRRYGAAACTYIATHIFGEHPKKAFHDLRIRLDLPLLLVLLQPGPLLRQPGHETRVNRGQYSNKRTRGRNRTECKSFEKRAAATASYPSFLLIGKLGQSVLCGAPH